MTTCQPQEKKKLSFKDFPEIQIGFSTVNFFNSMPHGVENIKEMIDYAAETGYRFIELRDPKAELTVDDCREIASHAAEKSVSVIYEIHKNLLDPGFMPVFERGLANTAVFSSPGILRTLLSGVEFKEDEEKKGWGDDEFGAITRLADSCAALCRAKNISFVIENGSEAICGEEGRFKGLSEFFMATSAVGLQFDTANPFLPESRKPAGTGEVEDFLGKLSGRWLTTHFKSGKDGKFQPFLDENYMPYEKVLELMSATGATYMALELAAVEDKQECFDNHAKSIAYLQSIGLID